MYFLPYASAAFAAIALQAPKGNVLNFWHPIGAATLALLRYASTPRLKVEAARSIQYTVYLILLETNFESGKRSQRHRHGLRPYAE